VRFLLTHVQTGIVVIAAMVGFTLSPQVTAQSSKAQTSKTQTSKAEPNAAQNLSLQPPLTKTQSVKAKRLTKIHDKIINDHPDIRHISRAGLQVWLTKDNPNLILLDTRPLPEYRVSHIDGAVQIDPDSQARKLDALELEGKIIVVYCSVGRRSSNFAQRLETELSQAGAQTVMNLEGGIFGWHNDGRARSILIMHFGGAVISPAKIRQHIH